MLKLNKMFYFMRTKIFILKENKFISNNRNGGGKKIFKSNRIYKD